MASKVSGLNLLNVLSGQEDVLIAYKGANWRVKISSILAAFDKKTINLDKVDNTSDLDKPISRAVQEALNAITVGAHSHDLSDIRTLTERLTSIDNALVGLAEALSEKMNASATFEIGKVNGLTIALQSKADADHHHDIQSVDGLGLVLENMNLALNSKADKEHTHEASTITGLDAKINELMAGYTPDVAQGAHEW